MLVLKIKTVDGWWYESGHKVHYMKSNDNSNFVYDVVTKEYYRVEKKDGEYINHQIKPDVVLIDWDKYSKESNSVIPFKVAILRNQYDDERFIIFDGITYLMDGPTTIDKLV